MSVRRRRVPASVRDLIRAFRNGLVETIGPNLVGAYLLGSVAFPGFEPRAGDIDFYVVVRRPLTQRQRRGLAALHERLAREFRFGKAIDGLYISLSHAGRAALPRGFAGGALGSGARDEDWALHRAHLRRGAYIRLHGPSPETFLPPPTWPEIERALEHNLADARAALTKYPVYAVLNLCRLIYTFDTGDPVTSKVASARWALGRLPARWRPLIRAAQRSYGKEGSRVDMRRLRRDAPPFSRYATTRIRMARRRARGRRRVTN